MLIFQNFVKFVALENEGGEAKKRGEWKRRKIRTEKEEKEGDR